MRRLFLAALVVALVCGPASGSDSRGSIETQPIQAIILADESGSLTPSGVAAERDAVTALVTSELSPRSSFKIIGFGSNNGRPGQDAFDDYCSFITVSNDKARDALADCAARIHSRTAAEGYDTDHAAALQHAVEELRSASKAAVIFLLTDGVLDVRNSPEYGADPNRRNAEAERRLREQILPEARRLGIQIWPLGFGREPTNATLQRFAAGGAGANRLCSAAPGAQPRAIIVRSTSDVIYSLVQALGRARCGAVTRSTPESATLRRGKELELKVTIPVIATDGAIAVTKADPSLRVTYYDPKGRAAPSSGAIEGQRFELSGEDGRVETLRIVSPLPGDWKIKVEDIRGRSHDDSVSAFAVWQGALQGSLVVTPYRPRPGETASLEVRVLSRDGIVPASALKNLRASGRVTGSFGTLPVPLRDDGKGVFRGSFVLPEGATGDVEVAAQVSGLGVSSDERTHGFTVPTGDFFSASFDLTVPSEIHPGAKLSGAVTVRNEGPRLQASLQLDVPEDAQMTVESEDRLIFEKGQQRIPFTLKLAAASPLGPLFGKIRLVGQDGSVLGETDIAAEVTNLPSFSSRHPWVVPLAAIFIGLFAATAVGALLRRRSRRVRERDTAGLVAALSRNGQPLPPIESPGGDEFVFSLVADGESARLVSGGSTRGERVVVARSGAGVTMAIGEQASEEHSLNEPIAAGDGLVLTITESYRRSSGEDLEIEEPTDTPADAAPLAGGRYGD